MNTRKKLILLIFIIFIICFTLLLFLLGILYKLVIGVIGFRFLTAIIFACIITGGGIAVLYLCNSLFSEIIEGGYE